MTTNQKRNNAGGAATAGGINFQAAVTAIISIHMARGRPLGWLSNCQDIPRSVDAETGGPGDDLACTLADGTRVEVQVKKGLTATDRLWTSLLDLAHGIAKQECDWGVLVVCPNCSSTIRDKLVSIAEPEVSVELRQRIFDYAFSVVAGKDRQDAYALALPLAECAERYPTEIAEFAFAWKDSEQSWSRFSQRNQLRTTQTNVLSFAIALESHEPRSRTSFSNFQEKTVTVLIGARIR